MLVYVYTGFSVWASNLPWIDCSYLTCIYITFFKGIYRINTNKISRLPSIQTFAVFKTPNSRFWPDETIGIQRAQDRKKYT